MTPSTNIEAKLNKFFLHNVAYCAAVKHRSPNESIFVFKSAGVDTSPDKDDATVLLIDAWIQKILTTSSLDNVLLMYYYFVDKDTLLYLRNKIFRKVEYDVFEKYFVLALQELRKLPLSTGNFFRYVNFYHLIGTMRLLPACDDDDTAIRIMSHLLTIVESPKLPLLIRFSSRQILVNHYFGRLNSEHISVINQYNELLQQEVSDHNSDATKFLALYYLYYYDFSYNINKLVEDLKEKLSPLDGPALHANLSTNVPQLHSLMIRKGLPSSTLEKLVPYYQLSKDISLPYASVSSLLDEIIAAGGEI